MKIHNVKLSIAVLALVSGVATLPVVANADVNDTKTGTTALTLTGDATAITLDSVPNFNWGSMSIASATTAQNATGTGNMQVTDSRGGSTGYVVTALASSMTASTVALPVSTMTIDTVATDTHLTGATEANILATNNVLTGDADSNGTRATTASTGHLSIDHSAKVGAYTGTITYTIVDGGLS